VHYQESAGESFEQGQFVKLDSSGQLTACADDDQVILGMALAGASGTQGNDIPVVLAQDGTGFIMNVYHSTPASALSAVNQLDGEYNLEVDSNRCYVDIENTAAAALQPMRLVDAARDLRGRVEAVVLPAAQQLGAATA
jgi:hypothetical protein